MTNIELFFFLGKCLALGEREEIKPEVISAICRKKVDWDRFVKLASNHLVLPSVYLRFKRQGIIHYLPEELSAHLRMICELNYHRNIAVLAQIDRINHLFASAGIVPIYLKGAANLIDHLYEDVGERILGDIDLLVADSEFIMAVELLKGQGYENYSPFHEDQLAVTKHYPRLIHPTEPLDVEVHRVPVELRLSARFNYEVIRQEMKPVETVPPCNVLSDRHKVVLNFMHGFMDSEVQQMNNVSFRNMVDLHLLSHRADVFEILSTQPQYASKAMVYASYVSHALGCGARHRLVLRSKFFIWKHNLLLKSKFWYGMVWLPTFLLDRIWTSYLKNIAGVCYSKPIRRHVFYCLSSPSWYKSHIKSYADSFRKNL